MSTYPPIPDNLPVFHPDQPEEIIPPYTSIPKDTPLDHPEPSQILRQLSKSVGQSSLDSSELEKKKKKNDDDLDLPPIILGCAPFGYGIYADKGNVLSDMPLRIVRLALRAGINAFDTSPWYHPSEIILGNVFSALQSQGYPRESYKIITKAGKYGPNVKDHIYKPDIIRKSVERSLKRMKTDYLDVVYLHDCEFVASPPISPAGFPIDALNPSNTAKYALEQPYKPLGQGDQDILDSLSVLRSLKSEGKIRAIGLAGYPLPVLLRLALLVLHNPPFEPLDVLQTYCHQTIQNPSLVQGYLEAFTNLAQVGRVMNAAPLSMGILTSSGGPSWHPAKKELGPALEEVLKLCGEKGVRLEDVACDYGYRSVYQNDGRAVPVVIGCKNLEELHLSLKSYERANNSEESKVEKEVQEVFRKYGKLGWSWQSPAPEK